MKRFYIAFALLIILAATTFLFVFVSGQVRATPASEPTNTRGAVVKSTRTQKKCTCCSKMHPELQAIMENYHKNRESPASESGAK